MEALLRQVKQQLESWPEWKSAHKIVLAISGGVDSMVLLDLMSEMVKLQEYSDKEIIVAHFNHQLRSPEEHITEQNLVKKQAEAREKEFKERMLAMMMENTVKKWESERISITVKDAYEKETFDSKTFKADHPELSAQYTKTSICKESLLIKLKS